VRINKIDLQIAAAFVGGAVGAGFASGQELMQFFVKFGYKGLWGAALAGFFFSILGGMTIFLVKEYRFKTYKDLLDVKLGPTIATFIDWSIIVFLFLGFSVMLSGSGALFKEHLGISSIKGIFLTEALVLLALAARHEGVLWFNCILTPLLVAGLLLVSFASLTAPASTPGDAVRGAPLTLISNNWICSSLLYVSYNMVGGIVVLIALASDNESCGVGGGIIGGLILMVLACSVVSALLVFENSLEDYQIPMLYLAFKVNPFMFYIYGAVLWAAMLTTAIADAYGLCRRLQYSWNLPYALVIVLMLICAVPLSLCDFSQLVARVYPLFGYLSLIITFVLSWEVLKRVIFVKHRW